MLEPRLQALVDQDYLPEPLLGKQFYHPTDRGLEERIRARLDEWKTIKRQKRDNTQQDKK